MWSCFWALEALNGIPKHQLNYICGSLKVTSPIWATGKLSPDLSVPFRVWCEAGAGPSWLTTAHTELFEELIGCF